MDDWVGEMDGWAGWISGMDEWDDGEWIDEIMSGER